MTVIEIEREYTEMCDYYQREQRKLSEWNRRGKLSDAEWKNEGDALTRDWERAVWKREGSLRGNGFKDLARPLAEVELSLLPVSA